MIQWPDETKLPPIAREGLARFRATTAALELNASDERWEIAAVPWLEEPPLRVQLQNQDNDAVDFVLDEDGMWRFEREQRHLYRRSAEAIADDAGARVAFDPDALPQRKRTLR